MTTELPGDQNLAKHQLDGDTALETAMTAQEQAGSPSVALDPEIVASLENSISVSAEKTKAGWSGVLYETICNTPIVLQAGAAALASDFAAASHDASGLLLVVPIYGAMGFGIWKSARDKKRLEAGDAAYRQSGDARYVDIVSPYMAEVPAADKIPHVRNVEKRAVFRRQSMGHVPIERKSLIERVSAVGSSLKSIRVQDVGAAAKSFASATADLGKTIGHDIAYLRHAPKNVFKFSKIVGRPAFKAAAHAVSAPGYDLVSASVKPRSVIAEELSLVSGAVRSAKAYVLPSLKEDVNAAVAMLTGLGPVFDLSSAQEKGRSKRKRVLGGVTSSHEVEPPRIDRDHCDRILYNTEVNNKWEKRLMAANMVGIAFETAFVVKYAKSALHYGEETMHQISANLQEVAEAGVSLHGVSSAVWGASGGMVDTGVSLFSGVLMASCALHHMLKTTIASDAELHDAQSRWAETVAETRNLDLKIAALYESFGIVFDPEETDEKVNNAAMERIQRITRNQLTPRSLPAELREQLARMEAMNASHNAANDEFAMPGAMAAGPG